MRQSSSSEQSRPVNYVTPYTTPLNQREPDQPTSILRQTPPSSWAQPTPINVRNSGLHSSGVESRHQPQLPRRRIDELSSRPTGLVLDAAGQGIIRPAFSSSSSVSQLSMSSAAPDNRHQILASGGGRRRARIRTPVTEQQPPQQKKKGGMVSRLYSHMKTTRRDDDVGLNSNSDREGNSATGGNQNSQGDDSATTAAEWARQQSPQAGFLQKMGMHVPVMKRRFFILQPGTHLYYFLSPTDATPRGCFDLEGSWVEQEAGTNRFSVCWEGGRRVVLEGRSPDVAQEWKQALEQERLSYCKAALRKERRKNSACTSRIEELETALQNFKLVEQDRDGALEDAAQWKQRFEQLDESCRLLTMQLRRQVAVERKKAASDGAGRKDREIDARPSVLRNESEEKKEECNLGEKEAKTNAANMNGQADGDNGTLESGIDASLFDADDDSDPVETMLDVMKVPGNHFSSLFNSCEQLRENHRLASVEATTAVEDLTDANQRVVTIEKRMAKAEKHLCKLWEENCALRKSLKQKKKEKTVLVREVKNLLEELKSRTKRSAPSAPVEDSANEVVDSDEEKLINELEEEIMCSIRLHEKFLVSASPARRSKAAVDDQKNTDLPTEAKIEACSAPDSSATVKFDASLRQGASSQVNNAGMTDQSPPQRNLLSLFDESFDDDASFEDGSEDDSFSPVNSVVSSVEAEAGDLEDGKELPQPTTTDHAELSEPFEDELSPVRVNPVDRLDDDEEDEEMPAPFTSSTHSESSRSVVTSNGPATSTLACPLVDVVSTANAEDSAVIRSQAPQLRNGPGSELQVYHLTFYSRKIGLQFQKVPPPPPKAKGLLTEAMTTDLVGIAEGGQKTAAELRRISAFISPLVSHNGRARQEDTCDVATPVDAVLVCGFTGFDDSGSNIRPKLGARLVAFDGVSVEIGRWTFESIRKAIQARSRPLTLSFRDDYLTTEQRQILTRAAQEVHSALLPPQRTVHYKPAASTRRPSMDAPSVYSTLSGDTDPMVGTIDGRTTPHSHSQEDDRSHSVSSDYRNAMPHSFSASRSVSSGNGVGGSFRSFSEAGSSVSMLSAVAPLVTNLLLKGGHKEPFTPEYLNRKPASVEDTPQHQDFRSELL